MNKGYCRCGCGKKVGIIIKTDRSRGHIKGNYLRFIKGHNVKFFKRFGKDNLFYGADFKGEKCPAWKGGKHKNNGYIDIYSPQHPFNRRGYVFEHRLIIEKIIGRYLYRWEVSHHINKIRDDNRPQNLMVFKNTGSHLKFEAGKKISKKEIIFDGRNL